MKKKLAHAGYFYGVLCILTNYIQSVVFVRYLFHNACIGWRLAKCIGLASLSMWPKITAEIIYFIFYLRAVFFSTQRKKNTKKNEIYNILSVDKNK